MRPPSRPIMMANVGAQLSVRCAPLGTHELPFRPHPAPRFCADSQAAERFSADSGRAWLDSVRQPESAERQAAGASAATGVALATRRPHRSGRFGPARASKRSTVGAGTSVITPAVEDSERSS